MFSYRSDKTGFFVTIILLVLLAAAVLSTILVAAIGGWSEYKSVLKIIWGTWWVLCIITVLVRLAVFRWQMIRREQRAANPPPGPNGPTAPGGSPNASEQTGKPSSHS